MAEQIYQAERRSSQQNAEVSKAHNNTRSQIRGQDDELIMMFREVYPKPFARSSLFDRGLGTRAPTT